MDTFDQALATKAAKLYDEIDTWEDKRGYTLSDRIWQQGVDVRMNMDAAIRKAIIDGRDVGWLAAELRQYIDPAWAAAAPFREGWLGDPAMEQHLASVHQTNFAAKRLAGNEMRRAHALATQRAANADRGGAVLVYKLSIDHPEPDECDTNAKGERRAKGEGEERPDPGKLKRNPSPDEVEKYFAKMGVRVQYEGDQGRSYAINAAAGVYREHWLAGDPLPAINFIPTSSSQTGPNASAYYSPFLWRDRALNAYAYGGTLTILYDQSTFNPLFTRAIRPQRERDFARTAPWGVSEDPASVIQHELGHYYHFQANDRRLSYDRNSYEIRALGWFLPDGTYVNDYWVFGQRDKMSPSNLSEYAGTRPTEFVAEAYAYQSMGYFMPPELVELYDSLGGPMITTTTPPTSAWWDTPAKKPWSGDPLNPYGN